MTIYENFGGAIIISLLILSVLVLAIHYIKRGTKGVQLDDSNNVIERFTRFERTLHNIRALTFTIAAISGLVFLFIEGTVAAGMMHNISGILFFTTSVITFFLWHKSFWFKPYDKSWLQHLGGYLTKQSLSLPAGKFNAGQKIFFWITILLPIFLLATGINLFISRITETEADGTILIIHAGTATLATILVVGHIYLSLWANKGTWRVLKNGKVSVKWAQSNHPNWEIENPKSKPSIKANSKSKPKPSKNRVSI
ncbi:MULTISPECIES: formate dehydrogenase subunit gamma [Exiguobacterium]|uniref:Formate dehydrogenase subunit gamma n=1 Tax=Exiguobacterium acetylicum TaxID=41170 RepID=A0ABX8GE08_EXIAC|nr:MULTISPECIES: formate dehydrogenase subunit gamma [Exiguobacterium]QWB31895.1 formate dehydrogenase subunit gamma [Exiguobacterium acetylicum]